MAGQATSVDFCTLGMFILDEIEFAPPKPPVNDIVGGAGTYAALGARIFSPAPASGRVGWIVDCGSDFPPGLRQVIDHWHSGVLMRETPHRLTTRGWNGYGKHEHRAFRYTTPKLRIDHHALAGTPLLWAKAFHLICSPSRCIDLVQNILALRGQSSTQGPAERPLFIWEPMPDMCVPEEAENCLRALPFVDIVSPNHEELGGFFGEDDNGRESVDVRLVERLCDQWLQHGIGPAGKGACVVRCGKDGCLIKRTGLHKWLPAYHQSADKVVDPTGGGNAFLGGFAVGLVRGGARPGMENLEEAGMWGAVSASLAIEQVGMPVLAYSPGGETWNGICVADRLSEFKDRVDGYLPA